MPPDALQTVIAQTWGRFAPPPMLTVSDWADAHRLLSAESSAEPGRWRTERVPYLREPMDALTDRTHPFVVLMFASQSGKTEALLNKIGRTMDLDPGPMLLIEPTLDMAAAVSKDRLAPMLRDTPRLRDVMGPAKGKDSSATILHKSFRGGALTLAGANSPASLASRPIRDVLADEVDRWPASVGAEGDPLSLAIQRTTTFRRRKIAVVSTPTVKGASRIEDWWAISDQRRYHVPCPHCGAYWVIEWEHVRWPEGNPDDAYLECPACLERIDDGERPAMVSAGEWRAERPASDVAGFHCWAVYAPWRSLSEIVRGFLTARHSLEMRQAWTNTVLAKLWEAPGEKVDAASLLARREDYGGVLPPGVQILTAGIDTQDDRLEALVLGWGAGEEVWVVERTPLQGDPEKQECWKELDELLMFEWPSARGGSLRVSATIIDSAGHKTQAVYREAVKRQVRKVSASIGRSGGSQGQLVSPPRPVRMKNGIGTVQLRTIDPDQLKALIYGRLRVTDAGPEYVHLPTSVGETFVDELTAEKLVTKRNKYGVPTKVWLQMRERNESLDCFVLATAALRWIAPTPARFDAVAAQVDHERIRKAATAGAPR